MTYSLSLYKGDDETREGKIENSSGTSRFLFSISLSAKIRLCMDERRRLLFLGDHQKGVTGKHESNGVKKFDRASTRQKCPVESARAISTISKKKVKDSINHFGRNDVTIIIMSE